MWSALEEESPEREAEEDEYRREAQLNELWGCYCWIHHEETANVLKFAPINDYIIVKLVYY